MVGRCTKSRTVTAKSLELHVNHLWFGKFMTFLLRSVFGFVLKVISILFIKSPQIFFRTKVLLILFGVVWGAGVYPEKPPQRRGEHANATLKGPKLDSNPAPSCCEVTVQITSFPIATS